jgi:lysozyme family protein
MSLQSKSGPGLALHYERLWRGCEIDPGRELEAEALAKRIVHAKARYLRVSALCGLPWQLVGCLHAMEAGCDFLRGIQDGAPFFGGLEAWNKDAATIIKRHPWPEFWTWSHAWQWLAYAEAWNGWGYLHWHPEDLSPYVWAATTLSDEHGKYTVDGQYRSNARTAQIGVAAILTIFNYLSGAEIDFLGLTTHDARAAGDSQWYESIRLQQLLNDISPAVPPLAIDGAVGPKTRLRLIETMREKGWF